MGSRHINTIPVGSFPLKVNIADVLQRNRFGLQVLGMVHERGSRKYKPYGWYNSPATTDSTVENNLNAIYRHFAAHSMGFPIDPEGLPHVFHMCCRAGMLVTTAYRNWSDVDQQIEFLTIKGHRKLWEDFSLYTTAEEVTALSKTTALFDELSALPEESLTPIVQEKVVDCLNHHKDIDQLPQLLFKGVFDPFSELTPYDELFQMCLVLARKHWCAHWKQDLSHMSELSAAERKILVP